MGLSLHSGAHMTLFPRVLELLRAAGAGEILLTWGGIIPPEDYAEFREACLAIDRALERKVVIQW